MALASVIKLSELEGARRIDAEYYQPKYLSWMRTLKKGEYKFLEEKAFVTDGIHNSIDYDPESGIRCFSAQYVKDNYFDLSGNTFISHRQHKLNLRTSLKKGDVLISSVGTIGNAAVITEDLLPANADRHVGIIRLKQTSSIDSYFLCAFLNSKFGKFETFREATGNVQLNLFIEKIKRLVIPGIGNREIFSSKVKLAIDLLRKSKSLYSQAEKLLLEGLGLKDFKPKYELSYTANLSKAFEAHRVDAEYFQPTYHELIEYLNTKFELKPLGKLLLDFQKGIEVGSENYEEEGKPFIRVSNLSVSGLVERDQKYLNEELYQQLKDIYEPKIGESLLTKDATPGIAYVVKESIQGIISSGILKLSINESEINEEYLALCINSIIGRLQVERDGGGSVITHWRPEQIKKLQIPILSNDRQQQIALLVQQSHEAKRRAKELLEEAKRKVEHMIETASLN